MLINVEIPTIVGILRFMSRINFVLRLAEYEKSFITLIPGHFVGLIMLWLVLLSSETF